jgi:hypothetical protein
MRILRSAGLEALEKWRDNGTMVKNAAERAGRSERFAARCRSGICRANPFTMLELMSVAVESMEVSYLSRCSVAISYALRMYILNGYLGL